MNTRLVFTLVGLALVGACTGSPPSEPPIERDPPATERRVEPEAQLPKSVSTLAVPEGLSEVRFDRRGLRARASSQAPWTELAGIVQDDAGLGVPSDMTPHGAELPSLRAWCDRTLPRAKGERQVVVAVPAYAPYAVAKVILRELFQSGARTAYVVVEGPDGTERAIRLGYPKTYARGVAPPPVLSVLVDLKGVSIDGVKSATLGKRQTFRCPVEAGCQSRADYHLDDIGRIALRAHTGQGLQEAVLIPHSGVRWDAVVGILDHLRDATTIGAAPGETFTRFSIAGSRRLRTTADEAIRGIGTPALSRPGRRITPPPAPAPEQPRTP